MAIIGTLPNILTNGTTADASQVMADFNFIVNQVNSNAIAAGFVSPGSLVNIQVFITSGTYTPSANATKAYVSMIGAGGGGGGSGATGGGTVAVGCGGNSGSYLEGWIPAGLVPTTLTIPGAGGVGGVGNANGATGSTTSFGTIFIAPGGVGGNSSGVFSPPFGQGNTTQNTAPSGTGVVIKATLGVFGGPGSAFSTTSVTGGLGASSPLGTGGQGGQGTSGGFGAFRFGAGGGGASSLSSTGAQTGGVGSGGAIIVYEYA